MKNPPRIWLDYRPIRIGWVVGGSDTADLERMASWNACLWGGRYNCVIPAQDIELADLLVSCFAVDLLLPVTVDDVTKNFINRFPHLDHDRWHDSAFDQKGCVFADIRHPIRRIMSHHDKQFAKLIYVPSWLSTDPLSAIFATQFGKYPAPDAAVADYRSAVIGAFEAPEIQIASDGEVPLSLLEKVSPFALTSYELVVSRGSGWLGPGIVLGSVADFDALVMFWNLRAAGAPLIFYDEKYAARLNPFTNAFLARLRRPNLDREPHVNIWLRGDFLRDQSWKPDLDFAGLAISPSNGGDNLLWNGMNVEPQRPNFSLSHRDIVPSYVEGDGKASASFALPERPFVDDDVKSWQQKYAVVISAAEYGEPASEKTFECPFVPRLNEFYGRNLHFDYDSARSQIGRLDRGAVAFITSVSTQRLSISAFRVFDWMKAFFELMQVAVERSEPGLRASRLIAQLGGLQDCRVLKIRGVRNLLRKYGVEESFTRSGAIEVIRDVDQATRKAGFKAFKNLHIEYRPRRDMKPDDVLRYLLERRVFRVGLELFCPNCQLPSWLHIDDIRSVSSCPYCDHSYDVTPQLKDRDWRYRRSGIFGRNDDQLGGVPVALTLQQLSSSLSDRVLMYSTAINFRSEGAPIEPCEADFVAVVAGARGISEAPVQVVFGEAKSHGAIDTQDIRKLGKLADAMPRELAESFILVSKTGTFSREEIELLASLNSGYQQRVIVWSRDELEPFYTYERSREKLGDNWHAVSLSDMARITQQLYFARSS